MEAAGSVKPFLKIDIEGSEYSILDDLVSHAAATAGLAIEFHNCGKHLDEIVAFAQRYPLRLIHVHVNNYSQIDERGCPDSIEMTFSSNSPQSGEPPILPHPLDMPNDGVSEEVQIRFC